MSLVVDGVGAIQQSVRTGRAPLLPHGAGTKPALSTPTEGADSLDVSELTGVVEYDPAELTFTALAGTPVAEITDALGRHGQYLPFDPPLAGAGATLGGTIAAGVSGPSAFRHGGVRNFIVGVQFVDGTGRLIQGGGRVVKNAAGFDLPKLLVGSAGRLGVIVQASFKVFPRPEATSTLAADLGDLGAALAKVAELGRGPMDLEALDVQPPGTLVCRLGGPPDVLGDRCERLAALLGAPAERLDGDDDVRLWSDALELAWVPAGHRVVKVALVAARAPGLLEALEAAGASARLSLGANVAWVAWPGERDVTELDTALERLGLAGQAITGPPGRTLLGRVTGGAFAARVRQAIDPRSRFLEA